MSAGTKSVMPEMRVRVPLSVHDEHARRAAEKGVSLARYHRSLLFAMAKAESIAALVTEVEQLEAQVAALSRERDQLRREVLTLQPYAAVGRMVVDVGKAFQGAPMLEEPGA